MLGECIVERLPAFALHQRNEAAASFLEKVARAFERGRALLDRRSLPYRERCFGGRHGSACERLVALMRVADHTAVDGRADQPLDPRTRCAGDDRSGLGRRISATHLGHEGRKACAVAELDPVRVAAGGAVKVARQRDLGMARMGGVADPALRAPQNGLDRHRRIGSDRHERGIRAVLQ